jgi:hypothetical protein
MSEFQVTEKEVRNLLKNIRRGNKGGWLNARDIRTKNKSAAEVRILMKEMVARGHAFDNWLPSEDSNYEICFSLLEKERMLADLDRFDPSLLKPTLIGSSGINMLK